MKTKIITLIVVLSVYVSFGQNFIEKEIHIPSNKVVINGTLLSSDNMGQTPLVIIIPGSGANNRDGNQVGLKANSLKYLAEELANQQIASYRYDKSTIALLKKNDFNEKDIAFDDFIDDAIAVIDYFIGKERFSKIIFVGHSQGSLVGMIASRLRADGFISIAGAGRPINEILLEQLLLQAPAWKDDISKTLDSLKNGKIDKNFNPLLASIFRTSVQPFLISWMQYNPQDEIRKLEIPILIVNGTKDIQVPVSDGELLHKATQKSEFQVIENMNHIFKKVKGDKSENLATYNNNEQPIMKELVIVISKFVSQIK